MKHAFLLSALLFCCWPAVSRAQQKGTSTLIELEPLIVDLDHVYSASLGTPRGPSMTTQIYLDGQLYRSFDGRFATLSTDSGKPAGTIYAYRYAGDEMGGSALGYNHVGNGPFFHPTIPVHSSIVSDITWQTIGNSFAHEGFAVVSEFCFADRGDIPSLALSKQMTAGLISSYSVHMGADYIDGNVLFPGSDYYEFAPGAVSDFAIGFWGEQVAHLSYQHQFSNVSAEGPLEVSLSADGYATATTTLSVDRHSEHDLISILVPTTGKSASQYLQEDGSEPLEPPYWVKKMGLEEKLTGKSQWLFPPLNRYADVNGDGVYDAGDLVAAQSSTK